MLISKLLLKEYKAVGQIMISDTLKLIKPMKTVDIATKLSVATVMKYTKPTQLYRDKNAVFKFMEEMLEEVNYCKQVMRNNFNKPLKND